MKNINIYPLKESEGSDLLDTLPSRFAYSINYIVPILSSNGSIKVQLINYEPETWKTWFPFYSTTNALHKFYTKSKLGIYLELNDHLKSIHSFSYYLQKAENEFITKFSCGRITTTKIIENLTQSEIKYSKTTGIWTIYKTDYVILTSLENYLSLLNDADENIELFDIDTLQGKDTCIYKSLPIVTNYCKTLKEKYTYELLKKYAISML